MWLDLALSEHRTTVRRRESLQRFLLGLENATYVAELQRVAADGEKQAQGAVPAMDGAPYYKEAAEWFEDSVSVSVSGVTGKDAEVEEEAEEEQQQGNDMWSMAISAFERLLIPPPTSPYASSLYYSLEAYAYPILNQAHLPP